MALTATANERVKTDVLKQLGMKDELIFAQSFNRPNLYYEVRKKPSQKKVLIIPAMPGLHRSCLSALNENDGLPQIVT